MLAHWRHLMTAFISLAFVAWAAPPIDNTCGPCSRKLLDSLNVYSPRPVRVNQAGYRPQDSRKIAFVANPSGTGFQVIDLASKTASFAGQLVSVGAFKKAGMQVIGRFNSVTELYTFNSPSGAPENIHKADFSALRRPGRYVVVCGKDTSAEFFIDEEIYNAVFETALKFFGVNRCGDTQSWIHEACHLKDGSALGAGFAGRLAGGWHDCGDHGKYSETEGYAALLLALTYCLWPQKAEDFYGQSYLDTLPFGTDGIPDVLTEAKVGADFIYALYTVSKEKGLIAAGDMYHSVGTGPGKDHNYWDVPENQDAQPENRGGPPRPVTAGIGSNVAGIYAAALAFFAWGWEPYDPVYAGKLRDAAIDIYDNIVMKRRGTNTTMPCCYPGSGQKEDDEAMAALALWFLTKEKRFGFDLWRNTDIRTNSTARWNDGEFAAGHLGRNPFHHGGWTTDYEQIHAFVIYAFAKLILEDSTRAAAYGLSGVERDSLLEDCIVCLKNSIRIGSNGSNRTSYPGINTDEPYHGVFTSADWGYNRYNLGMVNELFMYWDLTKEQDYFDIGIDNLNYNLGLNPWDMSFVVGAGSRNLQHPHNRAANPDGYNAGGFPYRYQAPKGALMGGAKPDSLLKDDWSDYTVTETCIDFSAQLLIPTQMLAKDLPPDNQGPLFSSVRVEQVTTTTAVISWVTNELSSDRLYLSRSPQGAIVDSVPAGLATQKSVTLSGLQPNTTYYFYLQGTDVRRNTSRDDNHGAWYSFTTTTSTPVVAISDVRVCAVGADRATIYWWTDTPASSAVEYGTGATLGSKVDRDDTGLPGLFHQVTLKNLTPSTTYYFDVISGGVRDGAGGSHYTLTTLAGVVDYDIFIKPTKKGAGTAHFYVSITNNESRPYEGLEVRFYYSMPAAQASTIEIHSFDKQLFDVGGTPRSLNVEFGRPVRMAAPNDDHWYIPITIRDTLPVAGRARFEMQFNASGWGVVPFSSLARSWSIQPHASGVFPEIFDGVDLSKGDVYIGPEFVETVNGHPEITYVRDPYITAYYKGLHLYGYPPDFQNNMPRRPVAVDLSFVRPVVSPGVSAVLDTNRVDFAGTAGAAPNGNISHIELNASSNQVPFSGIAGRRDSVSFTYGPLSVDPGTSVYHWVAWHNRDSSTCACAYRRISLEYDTVPLPTQRRSIVLTASVSGELLTNRRRRITATIVDSAGRIVSGETVMVTLLASSPAVSFFASDTATSALSALATQGTIDFWVSCGDTGRITIRATGSPTPGVTYQHGALELVVRRPPPWPVIVDASLVDSDCDRLGDRVVLTLSDTLASGQSLRSLEVRSPTRTVRIDPPSLLFTARTTVEARLSTHVGYERSTVAVLSMNVDGSEKRDSTAVGDGIAPAIIRAAVYDNAASSVDDILVTFSEPVDTASVYATTLLLIADADTATLMVVAIAGRESDSSLILTVTSASGRRPVAGDKLRLGWRSTAPRITDRARNAPLECNPAVTLLRARRPAPIRQAWYIDGNGDGRIDTATVVFAYPVTTDQFAAVSVTFAGGTDTVCRAAISIVDSMTIRVPLHPAQSIATSGRMILRIDYLNAFTTSSEVRDSAAPVLTEMTFLPGHRGESATPDTLVAFFSEVVGPISHPSPFEFWSEGMRSIYGCRLDTIDGVANRVRFTIRACDQGRLPGFSDSARIDPTAGVSDFGGAIQTVPTNRRVPIAVKTGNDTWEVSVAPNPFTPGVTRGPQPFAPSQTGTLVWARSSLPFPVGRDSYAQLRIYDALGNPVCRMDMKPKDNGFFAVWDGRNLSGRYVATGSYCAFIAIQDRQSVTKRAMIGVVR